MNRFRLFRLLVLGVLSGLALSPVYGQDNPSPRHVLTQDAAWLIGEATFIAGPHLLRRPEISPDGNALLAVTTRRSAESVRNEKKDYAETDLSLVYWDRFRQNPTTLWRYHAPEGEVLYLWDVHWFADSQHATITLTHSNAKEKMQRAELLLFDVTRGVVRTLPLGTGLPRISANPTKNLLALTDWDAKETKETATVRLLNTDGNIVQTLSLPLVEGSQSPLTSWQDADNLNVVRLEPRPAEAPGNNHYVVKPYLLNIPTGNVTTPARSASPADTVADLGAALALRLVTQKAEKSPPLTPIYDSFLESTTDHSADGRAVLAGDAQSVQLLGKADGSVGALYTSHGMLFYAPLVRQLRARFLSDRDEHIRKQMEAGLKQINSALEQYALDNQGYPPPGSDVRDLLVGADKYLRRDDGFRNLLTGELAFTYTYSGGLPGSNGKEIPIATLKGPGGQFVLTNKGITYQTDKGAGQ